MRQREFEGRLLEAGESFALDVHFFDLDERVPGYFVQVFLELAKEGISRGRVPVSLQSVHALRWDRSAGDQLWRPGQEAVVVPAVLEVDLFARAERVTRVKVEFLTPIELKSGGQIAKVPEFGILFRRMRDRMSGLTASKMDVGAMAERADRIRLTGHAWRHERVDRRSTRTGQVHPLGGFAGWAEYEGELTEFLPWLRAAYWTGVGRHTVWGYGAISIEELNKEALGKPEVNVRHLTADASSGH